MRSKFLYLATILILFVAVGSVQAAAPAQEDDQEKYIILLAHTSFGTPGGFWFSIKNGADTAAKDFEHLGVRLETLSLEVEDPSQYPALIDAAVAKNPDGIAVSLPDPDGEGPSLRRAIEKGIPVITYNSGVDDFKEVGAIAHVGSIEYDAGYSAGLLLYDEGARNVICVNEVPANIATATRCQAIKDAMESEGGTSKQVPGDLGDAVNEKNSLDALAISDPTIDAFIGIGVPHTMSACRDIKQNRNPDLHCATFDTFPEAMTGIEDGTVDFAIAQQGFLQGYLPVQMLAQYLEYGVLPGGRSAVIPTGPFFVDKTNVEAIKESVANSTF